MIGLGRKIRVFAWAAPVDQRKSFWTLSALVESAGHTITAGDAFVFVGRARRRAKVLWFDGTGLVLLSKVLEDARIPLDKEFVGQRHSLARHRRCERPGEVGPRLDADTPCGLGQAVEQRRDLCPALAAGSKEASTANRHPAVPALALVVVAREAFRGCPSRRCCPPRSRRRDARRRPTSTDD